LELRVLLGRLGMKAIAEEVDRLLRVPAGELDAGHKPQAKRIRLVYGFFQTGERIVVGQAKLLDANLCCAPHEFGGAKESIGAIRVCV
jgi:hypothetical protein